MEEALRGYFLRNGYYVLRAVPFAYNGFDVTDVDLWLYDKQSPIVRHRVVVDIKNKKTPQAIERIFWAKGLQATLALDQAVVATTDRRPDVAEFGRQHGVLVIDGNFLSRLTKDETLIQGRLSEEEFTALFDTSLGAIASQWKTRLRTSKQLVLEGLGFDQINYWLSEAGFFAEQTITVPTHRKLAARLLYLVASLVAVAVDYSLREMTFLDARSRTDKLNSGFQYGTAGADGTSDHLNIAIGLVEQYLKDVPAAAGRLRTGFSQDIADIPTAILSEYFARASSAHNVLYVGKLLEAAAYDLAFQAPSDLPLEAKAYLSVLLDFWGIDRGRFMSSLVSDTPTEPATGSPSTVIDSSTGPLFTTPNAR